MMTHRMRIRRHLRSARVSALTAEERRLDLQAADQATARKSDRPEPEAAPADDVTPTTRAGTP
jgi:hypothetical protein